jgi:hypothetical protein
VSTVGAVRRVLSSAPVEELCDACLALACAASLSEMRAVTETLIEADPGFHRGASCARCRRSVPTIVYRSIGPGRRGRRAATGL